MCSAWTVTLHHQMLATLARALRSIGRDDDATPLDARADAVRADFRRLLIADGVLAGYALFDDADGADVRHLLHPRDATTGVRYSALAMIHAIDDDLFDARRRRAQHLRLIDEHLRGPDGVRLFDRPLAYHGGTQRLFQRAESASFFGREIGLMYMHAHLRYAQALAHVGDAAALLRCAVAGAPDRDRAIACRRPRRGRRTATTRARTRRSATATRRARPTTACADGSVALDGGWRVYSSGAGIALHLIVGHLLGLRLQARRGGARSGHAAGARRAARRDSIQRRGAGSGVRGGGQRRWGSSGRTRWRGVAVRARSQSASAWALRASIGGGSKPRCGAVQGGCALRSAARQHANGVASSPTRAAYHRSHVAIRVTRMKTTIEISDELLERSRKVARREGGTSRAMVEEGLRLALRARERKVATTAVRLQPFRGDV